MIEYFLQYLTRETTKLLGSIENVIGNDKMVKMYLI